MDIIRFSIVQPVTVIVGVILVVLFGIVSFRQLPYQLSPTLELPEITVSTVWPGATPYEIERDIIEEQEKVLKGLPRLYEMESDSSNGRGRITLRFEIGTAIEEALLRVSNKLNEVPSYPENVDKPVLNASGAEASPVIFLALQTREGNPNDIYHYATFFENDIRQFLERVDGVSEVSLNSGTMREMQVRLDPRRLAAYGLTISNVIAALRGENVTVSAGSMPVGRRDYRIRTVAEFRSPEDIANVVVRSDGQRRVLISDVAAIDYGYEKLETPALQDGRPGLSISIRAEPGANVLSLTDEVERVIQWLNTERLPREGLEFLWLADRRPYINGALNLLRANILIGSVLAICVLLLFLRSLSSTVVVATAIPISMIGSFLFMRFMGTTLNAVSLAGIAFAVGMLLDNAIVVLENIDRHRKMGKDAFHAAYDGAREVWGAVLASTLTTVAVFLPVIFLQQEAGQLFREIAIAVTASVSLSLIVSITVIPMFSKQLYAHPIIHRFEKRSNRPGVIVRLGNALAAAIMLPVRAAVYHWSTRLATVSVLAGAAAAAAWFMFPKMEYLPQGNRELIMNMLIPPPGLSFEERHVIGRHVSEFLEPYHEPGYKGLPGIDRVFFIGRDQAIIAGVLSKDQQRAAELIPVCREMIASIPGVFGVSNQASIFGGGIGRGGRTIDVDISGGNLDGLVDTAGRAMALIREAIPDVQIRPNPSLDMQFPEVRFAPDGDALRAVGMTAQDLAIAVDVLMDGRDIGDFKQEGEKKIDLVVKVAEETIPTPEALFSAPIPTPNGTTVPLSSLARMEETTGLTSIRHLERERTISLQVTPPYSVTIQEAMEIIQGPIQEKLRAQGVLDDVSLSFSGTADKLVQTREALQMNFVLAAMITYLLMSALFGNFLYPLIIMFTVPLAGAGGLVGLKLLNIFIAPQQLDVLTMLGFIILIGVVVNNAILIVHQSLNNIRFRDMEYKAAILDATHSRLRPIYMTAATSVSGMLPLVISPGPGSELYRGLGSVVLGGLAMSTILTVYLIPALLMFAIGFETRRKKNLEAERAESEAHAPADPVPAK